jgi:hypothetical protein
MSPVKVSRFFSKLIGIFPMTLNYGLLLMVQKLLVYDSNGLGTIGCIGLDESPMERNPAAYVRPVFFVRHLLAVKVSVWC